MTEKEKIDEILKEAEDYCHRLEDAIKTSYEVIENISMEHRKQMDDMFLKAFSRDKKE